jgi:hypothetical protein
MQNPSRASAHGGESGAVSVPDAPVDLHCFFGICSSLLLGTLYGVEIGVDLLKHLFLLTVPRAVENQQCPSIIWMT